MYTTFQLQVGICIGTKIDTNSPINFVVLWFSCSCWTSQIGYFFLNKVHIHDWRITPLFNTIQMIFFVTNNVNHYFIYSRMVWKYRTEFLASPPRLRQLALILLLSVHWTTINIKFTKKLNSLYYRKFLQTITCDPITYHL